MDAGSPKRSSVEGLRTALDTIVAPKDAFGRLRLAPTWGWALLLTVVACMLSSYIVMPALVHAVQLDFPRQIAASPQLAAMTPEQQRSAFSYTLLLMRWSWTFVPVGVSLVVLVSAALMFAFKSLGHGDAPFRCLWAAAANIALPTLGIAALASAGIVLARGSGSFGSAAEVQGAIPSLGMLVSLSSIKLHAFLTSFNPFTLWGCGLTIAAMSIVAGVPRTFAWATGIVSLLLTAGIAALGAR